MGTFGGDMGTQDEVAQAWSDGAPSAQSRALSLQMLQVEGIPRCCYTHMSARTTGAAGAGAGAGAVGDGAPHHAIGCPGGRRPCICSCSLYQLRLGHDLPAICTQMSRPTLLTQQAGPPRRQGCRSGRIRRHWGLFGHLGAMIAFESFRCWLGGWMDGLCLCTWLEPNRRQGSGQKLHRLVQCSLRDERTAGGTASPRPRLRLLGPRRRCALVFPSCLGGGPITCRKGAASVACRPESCIFSV